MTSYQDALVFVCVVILDLIRSYFTRLF